MVHCLLGDIFQPIYNVTSVASLTGALTISSNDQTIDEAWSDDIYNNIISMASIVIPSY